MKKQIKRIIAMALCIIFALTAAGCGKKEIVHDEQAKQRVSDAVSILKTATSMQTRAEKISNYTINNQKRDESAATQVSMQKDPYILFLEAPMTVEDGSVQNLKSYITAEEDKYFMYTQIGTDDWVKDEIDAETAARLQQQMDSVASMELFLSYATKFASEGKDVVVDSNIGMEDEAEKIICVVEKQNVAGLMQKLGVSQNIVDQFGMDVDIQENLTKNVESIEMIMWIDEKTGAPLRFYVDLAKTMKIIYGSIFQNMQVRVNVEEMSDQYTFLFVNDTPIQIPQEALDAKMSESTGTDTQTGTEPLA